MYLSVLAPGARTESQGNILRRRAGLDLTASWRSAVGPGDRGAGRVGAFLDELLALEGITKNAAEIIPDLGAVKGVGEVELGSASVEAVASGRDFDGLAASLGVFDKRSGVRPRLRGQTIRTGDSAADGPDADFESPCVATRSRSSSPPRSHVLRPDVATTPSSNVKDSVDGWDAN